MRKKPLRGTVHVSACPQKAKRAATASARGRCAAAQLLGVLPPSQTSTNARSSASCSISARDMPSGASVRALTRRSAREWCCVSDMRNTGAPLHRQHEVHVYDIAYAHMLQAKIWAACKRSQQEQIHKSA